MDTTTTVPLPTPPQDKCPHCGACLHCGQRPPPVYIPYIQPASPSPWWQIPQWTYAINTTATGGTA